MMSTLIVKPIKSAYYILLLVGRRIVDFVLDLAFRWFASRRVSRRLPAVHDPILLCSAVTLARKIRSRQITSEHLVKCCIERINETQPLLNAVVDERFASALEDAMVADRIISCLGDKALGALVADAPFMGVPFSTKEGIRVKGLNHSYGSSYRAKVKAREDADVVRLLRQAGAIPLCVTNVSELATWWESSNSVYGQTNNPYDVSRTPGGSSGGEAALQAASGIPISVGSDAGGSVRTPAAFCGLFGHKPSAGVVAIRGTHVVDPPKDYVSSMQTVGPLSRHAEDLVPLLSVLAGKSVEQLELQEEVYLSKLRYFYMDGGIGGPEVSPVCPEVRQALRRVICYLEDSYGVDVQPVRFPSMENAFELFELSVRQDDYSPSLREAMSHSILREWIFWILRCSQHNFPFLVSATMDEVDNVVTKLKSSLFGIREEAGNKCPIVGVETLKNEFLELLGDDGVLLCPPFPSVATYHKESYFKPTNVMYTAIFNVIGAPATVVPVGMSHKENMPLSVQVVAAPMQDRITLAVAKALERPFGGWSPPFPVTFDTFY